MSEIRMCDNCAEIFSLNVDGWDEYQKRNGGTPGMNNGNTRTMHICATCNTGRGGSFLTPRLALGTSNEEKA